MRYKERIKEAAKFVVLLILLFLLFKFILLPTITSPEFKQFTESLGVFGYLIIIIYIVASHVFAPVAGTPGVALGVTIYGIQTGMILLFIAQQISASINFFISKRLGRPWVERLVGKESMIKVDEFAAVEGKQVLIISRLIGFSLFDFISYAAGLTKLRFKDYFMITAVFGLIPILLFGLVFKDINFQSEQGIMVWMGSIGLAGIVFGILMRHYLKKQFKLNNNKQKRSY